MYAARASAGNVLGAFEILLLDQEFSHIYLSHEL